MNTLLALWLPILLSAVVVFIISSLIHMVIKWHAGDYGSFANEEAVRAAIRAGDPAPGRYVLPHCADMKDMGSEAMLQKYREGPVGHVTIGPTGAPVLGKFLGQWFVWSLIVAAVAAYLAGRVHGLDHSHARGAAKLVGAVTFIAHGFGTVTESIWMMRPWSASAKYLLDAALYGLGSGLVFLWLWP
ncbi:MAG: hypothetical protein HZA93_22280 [Verrucomicrobia bacterium]|nr:hypothetical protein [Verrucomicrobiota bacterium]